MTYICAGCKTSIQPNETKGSVRHPYCEKCFKEIWDGDDVKYTRWLNTSHLFC